jgi:hypothetical protein
MQPELIIKGQPIDYELCELLGNKPVDFIVICFDGVQLEDFGTPYDTPKNRAERLGLVDRLNDRSTDSLWPELWMNWKPNICRQFGLPETTTSDQYSPVVSCKISRVCHGYSEHLHAAIGLFETIADKLESWSVSEMVNRQVHVEIFAKDLQRYARKGKRASLVIAETVRELLMANQDNDPSSATADAGRELQPRREPPFAEARG